MEKFLEEFYKTFEKSICLFLLDTQIASFRSKSHFNPLQKVSGVLSRYEM